MQFHTNADPKAQPTLEEMTEKAIAVLNKEKNGYFLFVEGGLIDAAHHLVFAKMALDETVEMAKAVQRAVDMTDEDDTLIVVTADHSHVMTMSGYPERGNKIGGLSGSKGLDDLPYSTLSYANGPSAVHVGGAATAGCGRQDLSKVDTGKTRAFTVLSQIVPKELLQFRRMFRTIKICYFNSHD